MLIRLANEGDISRMLDIYRPYVEQDTASFEYITPTQAEFTARFRRITAAFPWYVAEVDGTVAGYAYADRAFERQAYCWDADLSVYIDRAYHSLGLGRALYARLEADLTHMGYVNAYAIITGENRASIAFHRKMGYTLVATLPHTGFKMGRWLSVAWYAKVLRQVNDPGDVPQPFEK